MKKIVLLRITVLAAAIILIVMGMIQNGYMDVMNKAIRICYECIGIG